VKRQCGSARDTNIPSGREASSTREAGDLLKIADGRIAMHVVLLLDVFKFRRVDIHPGQNLGGRTD
jgi:hypothetical protein